MTQSQLLTIKALLSEYGAYHSLDKDLIYVQAKDCFRYYGKSPKGWSLIATASFDVSKAKETENS